MNRTFSDAFLDAMNRSFGEIAGLRESCQLLDFLVQPHVLHLNRVSGGGGNFHTHRTFECSMPVAGRVCYHIADRRIEAESGDLVVIPAETPHCWNVEGEAVVFSMMLFISSPGSGTRRNLKPLCAAVAERGFVLVQCPVFRELIEKLFREQVERQTGFREKSVYLLRESFVEIFREMLPQAASESHPLRLPPKRGNTAVSTAELVVYYLRDNLHRPLKMGEISSHIGLSPDHLNRLFRQVHGATVCQYLARCRLERARALLVSTDRPLKDIAAAVGYEDVNYFCRCFKKSTGETPSEHRRHGTL